MNLTARLRARALAIGLCAASVAACGKPPSPVTPPVNDRPALAPIPADKGQPTAPSHAEGQVTQPVVQQPPAAPPVDPVALPPMLPPMAPPGFMMPPLAAAGPSTIAFTSELDWRGITFGGFTPFGFTGSAAGLFVYDDLLKDNFAIPGAGLGIQNPQTWGGGSKILFNRAGGTIWFYDILAEINVQFNDVNTLGLPVIRPSITQDGTIMTFVACPGLVYSQGIAMIWLNGVTAELAKVNAVGVFRGGISWIRISANGRWAVFTTGDGGLFVYDVLNPLVYEVVDARAVGLFATHPDISPDGSQIVWTGLGPNGSLKIFRYDRIAHLIDPMPFANVAMNAFDAFDARFLGPDSTWITYDAFIHGHLTGGVRVLGYNWLTEAVRTFTILNNVLGEGVQLVSDIDD